MRIVLSLNVSNCRVASPLSSSERVEVKKSERSVRVIGTDKRGTCEQWIKEGELVMDQVLERHSAPEAVETIEA